MKARVHNSLNFEVFMRCAPDLININKLFQPNPELSPQELPLYSSEYSRIWRVIYGCNSANWKNAKLFFLGLSNTSRTWIEGQIHSDPINYLSSEGFPGSVSISWKSETFYNLNDLDKAARELGKKIFRGLNAAMGKGSLQSASERAHVPPNLVQEYCDYRFFLLKNDILEIVDRWVENAPEGENRIHCREQIFQFINDKHSHNFRSERLDFSNCRLTSLPEIFHFDYIIDRLKVFILSGNQLRSLPDSFRLFCRLVSLSLDSNPLESIPRPLFLLPNLGELSLSTLPKEEKVTLSKDDLLWATYWFLYEKPQEYNIPLHAILEMKNSLKPSSFKLKDFKPTEASSQKTSNCWDCIGEMTTPEGQQLFLFKFINESKEIFPAQEPSELYARASYETETPFKYHYRTLGFQIFHHKKTNHFYLILPSIHSFLKRWQKLTEQCAKHLTLPRLTAFVSPETFSDQEFINAYFDYDLIISENHQFVHDMWFHTTYQLYRIFEVAAVQQPVFSMEKQRIKSLLQKKRERISFIYNNLNLCNPPEKRELLLKYRRPIITAFAALIDIITLLINTSSIQQDRIDNLNMILRDSRWNKYFIHRYSDSTNKEEYVSGFELVELNQAWESLWKT